MGSEVTTKLFVAVCFAAENKSAVSHLHYTVKTLKLIQIKLVGHSEELQLLTFCDNWENVETRSLYTGYACVNKNNNNNKFC